jgi:TetR/AcrR family transcriptional regulator
MSGQQIKNKHSEARLKIMHAARDVFAETGFAGARMDEIARRAGVNKATIYYHIGDKKALYAEVIHQVIGDTTDRIEESIRHAPTPEEKIITYMQTIAKAMDMNPQMPPIIMREIASGGGNLPDVFVLKDFARIVSIVKNILDEGVSLGVFTETAPLLLHLMIASTFAVCKMSIPIRERFEGISDDILLPDGKLAGPFTAQVGEMILKALRGK